jgi:hypothetical protein
MKSALLATGVMLIVSVAPVRAQQPTIFSLSDVVAGSQRLETRFAFVEGKWSDAGNDVAIVSTKIHCYKRFGVCEVASAFPVLREATVSLDSFDILRWDDAEIIAVDSSPICTVNTLRLDLVTKKVSLSSISKAETRVELCNGETATTTFLTGLDDEYRRIDTEAKPKK